MLEPLRGWFSLAACLFCSAAGAEAASPRPEPNPSACGIGRHPATSEIACELGVGLGALSKPAVVVSAPLVSDAEVKDAAGLVELLGRVVAGRFGEAVRSGRNPASLAEARAEAARSRVLVYLRPVLRRGRLEVSADVYPAVRGFWDRVRDPEPSPILHAFSGRTLDPELRTYLTPIPLVARSVERASLGTGAPVALACADIDGDLGPELLVVDRTRVSSVRLRGRRVVAHASVPWSELVSVAPSPLRQPIAGAMAEGERWIVGLTDRAEVMQLDAALRVTAREPRKVPWPPSGCTRVEDVHLLGRVEPCFAGEHDIVKGRFERQVDAVAGATFLDKKRRRAVRVARNANRDTAVLLDDTGRERQLSGVGAQLVVADLDADGQPEIVSSAPTLDSSGDFLRVSSWLDNGQLVDRYRLDVPDGVRAVTVCPREDSARPRPVVLATNTEIWVVR